MSCQVVKVLFCWCPSSLAEHKQKDHGLFFYTVLQAFSISCLSMSENATTLVVLCDCFGGFHILTAQIRVHYCIIRIIVNILTILHVRSLTLLRGPPVGQPWVTRREPARATTTTTTTATGAATTATSTCKTSSSG